MTDCVLTRHFPKRIRPIPRTLVRNPYPVEEESVRVGGGVAEEDYVGLEVIAKNGQSFAIR